MQRLTVYLERANRDRLALLINGVAVTALAVTRVDLSLLDSLGNEICISTANPGEPIELLDDNTVVEFQLGLMAGIVAGKYQGFLTVYDAASPEGIAWEDLVVTAKPWEICD